MTDTATKPASRFRLDAHGRVTCEFCGKRWQLHGGLLDALIDDEGTVLCLECWRYATPVHD